ncbi:MAG: DoxX family protein [Gemmatimonadetes bacterium]|nr:DoxX family protein [Gemmatimonadota bacterium]MCK5482230.1 DoxX family protein [Gemmatimonadota bacterium]MCK5488776.1 DoxX family protein [Gemmatimonadota bacterium]
MDEVGHTRYQELAWTILRIVVGLAFMTHGLPKLFGWLGGFGGAGEAAELMSRFGVAGVLETFGGLLIVLGLLTRPVAFVLSGQMAVTYFWMHVGRGELWWWENGGEKAMLFSFVFLCFAAWGAGPFSVDAKLAARRE